MKSIRLYPFKSILLLLALLCTACEREPLVLAHDTYIWQRVWTPAVNDAVYKATPAVRQWRVLGAQADGQGNLKRFQPDWGTLIASDRPIIVVIRIDGQLKLLDEARALDDIDSVWKIWSSRSSLVVGVEIDHDCGTARLSDYAQFLHKLRTRLPDNVQLSITALPDWLRSKQLEDVLAQVDQSVLQVHAVSDLQGELFHDKTALAWVNAYASRHVHPFLVTLPNYGSRVSWDAQGRITGVSSEVPTIDAQASTQELLAKPEEIANFIDELHKHALPNLVGIAWFRLPTAKDRRAWSVDTWLAVLRREPLKTHLVAFLLPDSKDSAFYRVILENKGVIDVGLPMVVELPMLCESADALSGYAMQNRNNLLSLQRHRNGLLHAGQVREIGWARCPMLTRRELQIQK